MLQEGWDVTNLHTIVPLRAAHARILIEQSIGRGRWLPYGRRAGVAAVDRLSIIVYDKVQEIIDEANRPDSAIRLQQVILDPTQDLHRMVAVVSQPNIEAQITPSASPLVADPATSASPQPIFTNGVKCKIADDHADLLCDLAGQMVKHFLSYLSEKDARNVLIYHQRQLVEFIHVQMQAHYWEQATGYDVKVSKGFTRLRESAFTAPAHEPVHDFRQAVQDRSRIAQMVFGGFQRGLYSTQKFQSDSERKLAIVLDREALKWFKPARGQFQMYYKLGADHLEYQPDFVAETTDCIYMLEAKARNDMHPCS